MDGVEVARASLLRSWRKAHRSEFWVEFRTADPDSIPLDNALEEMARSAIDSGITVRNTSGSPKGHVVFVAGADTDDNLIDWVEDLGRRIESHGGTGTLRAAAQAPWPRWFGSSPPVPTAYMTWSYGAAELADDPTLVGDYWKADVARTEVITDMIAEFVAPAGPLIIIQQGTFEFVISEPDRIADLVTTAVRAESQGGVQCIDNRAHYARTAGFFTVAQTVLQEFGGTTTWEDHVTTLTQAITEHPDLLDQAFIRTGDRLTRTWFGIGRPLPLFGIKESAFRYNQHLTVSHVIDAHGVQVLTDTHLEHVHNLNHWNVRDLGHGRHLVTAHDLEPWYSDIVPDARTHQQARADFADILLTAEAIKQHPPPWRKN